MRLAQIAELQQLADTLGLSAYYVASTDISSGNPMYTSGVLMSGELSALQILTGQVVDADTGQPFSCVQALKYPYDVDKWGIGFFLYPPHNNRRFARRPIKHSRTRLAQIAKIMATYNLK